MRGRNKYQNIKKSPQRKNCSNIKNKEEMPAINPSKLHSQVEFASNIFKLYSGINQSNEIPDDIKREKLNLINNIQNKLNSHINNNKKKENIKNQNEIKNNYKNNNRKILSDKIKKISKNNNLNNNVNNNNIEQKEDINLLIAQYNEELDSKIQQGLINNNNNYNNDNIQENINQLNYQFASCKSNQNNQLNIEKNLDLPQIGNTNINHNLNQNMNTNNISNNIITQNQDIIQQNISEVPNNINNNLINNKNSIDLNQNYKYPETNQMIDNIQYLNNNINEQTGNNNISNPPWIQMNLTYEEYEKKRIKEENRKKQEEFKKMLDEQRMQKLINKEKKNVEEQFKKQNINTNPKITFPLIVNNSLQSPLRKNIENKVENEENIQQNNNNEVIDNNDLNLNNQNQVNENDGGAEIIIAKRYQDMLNSYINEKTKDVELQRNQAINDNNSVEDIDNENNANNKLVVENVNNIKRLDKKAKNRIFANPKEKNMRNNDELQNENNNKNRTEFNTFRKGLNKKGKNQNMNKNDIGNKVSVIDNKNLTGNRMHGKSTNMTKIYKLEDEPRKNESISAKKEGEINNNQRAKSFIPKIKLNYKSSETKIKYNIKERKKSQNQYKKKFDEIENDQDQDPINKLQNIQKFIKGILHDFKDK